MGESRVAWRPLILLVLASASVSGAPGEAPVDWRSADDIGSPRGLSTGNRAVDMLLQQTQLQQAAMAASGPAPNQAARANELLAAKQQVTDDAKSTRDALLREAAMLAEQQKAAQPVRSAEGGDSDAIQGRAGNRAADASPGPGTPAALQGWRATVKQIAVALRENREWIIGIAVLIGVAVLSVRTAGSFRLGRGGRHGGYPSGRH